ncbi:hypothetical protein QCA50_018705 [Cerrena zonata]|uniref:Uncharacterized protein n=1 Tax=Cerrena zonata TaxID=2478898 RepID=A0AAW0FCR2_9APHY
MSQDIPQTDRGKPQGGWKSTFTQWANTMLDLHRSGSLETQQWFVRVLPILTDANLTEMRSKGTSKDVDGGLEVLRRYVSSNWSEDWRSFAGVLAPVDSSRNGQQIPSSRPMAQTGDAGLLSQSRGARRRKSAGDIQVDSPYTGPVTRKRAREQSGVGAAEDISPSRAPPPPKRVTSSASSSAGRRMTVAVEIPKYKQPTSPPSRVISTALNEISPYLSIMPKQQLHSSKSVERQPGPYNLTPSNFMAPDFGPMSSVPHSQHSATQQPLSHALQVPLQAPRLTASSSAPAALSHTLNRSNELAAFSRDVLQKRIEQQQHELLQLRVQQLEIEVEQRVRRESIAQIEEYLQHSSQTPQNEVFGESNPFLQDNIKSQGRGKKTVRK